MLDPTGDAMPESEDLLLATDCCEDRGIPKTGDLDSELSFMSATSGLQGLTSLFFKGLGVET